MKIRTWTLALLPLPVAACGPSSPDPADPSGVPAAIATAVATAAPTVSAAPPTTAAAKPRELPAEE